MNWSKFVGVDGTALVNRLTNNINNSAKSLRADGHKNGSSSVSDGLTTDETFGGVKSDGSDVVATKMLGDFEDESVFSSIDFESVENRGQRTLKLHVDDGTNNLRNLSFSNSSAEATYIRQLVRIG